MTAFRQRMGLSTGTRLGPYEIIDAIGAGGMGEVYRARDTRLKRDVAIKVLPAAFSNDADRLARFQREAELLASLNHPNIAAVYGIEDAEAEGLSAIVLELVEGETLAERIARGPIPIDEAIPIARQIADALEAAHEKGVIHRDLKPANVKVTPEGKVKVLDFGLAKMVEGNATASGLTMSPTLSAHATNAGMILGTAAYMSPEQARGRPVDRRTDIWSFGCVLFEMLTGRMPFDAGDSVSDAVAAILKTDPDWTALPADTPVYIRRLLRRCLQKDPQQRLPHVGLARIEFDDGPADTTSAAPAAIVAPTPPWRRAAPAVTAALAAAAVAGFVTWKLRPSPQRPIVRLAFSLGEGQAFTNPGRHLVAISPDGTQIVYVANERLYLRPLSETQARPIGGIEASKGAVLDPIFAPDGQSVAFWASSDQTMKRIPIGGGTAVTICQMPLPPFGMNWGESGIVFGQGSGGVKRVVASGGRPERLVEVATNELAHGPQILPGGDAVLFTLANGSAVDRWDRAKIVVQSLKSGERHVVVEGGTDARYVPTGHVVYALGGTMYAVPFDLRRLEVRGVAVPIVEGVRRASGAVTGTSHFSFSDTGSLAYVPGPAAVADQRILALFDRGTAVQPLKIAPGVYEQPRVSPDGKRVAFQTDDSREAIVWIYDLSGAASPRRLTFSGHNRFPIWTSNGERVAFQSDREGDLAIFWQRADGNAPAERLTKPEAGVAHVPESWAPSGDRFLFASVKDSKLSLWMFTIAGKTAAPVGGIQQARIVPTSAVFSPDGRWIAYTSSESGWEANVVFVEPYPGIGAKYQIASGSHPAWSPDGTELFFNPGPGRIVAVSITTQPTFSVGNPVAGSRQFFDTPFTPRQWDVMPDGRFLGMPFTAQQSGNAAGPAIEVVLNWFDDLKQRVAPK